MRIEHFIPSPLHTPIKRARSFVHAIQYRGVGRLCPVCRQAARAFGPSGVVRREDARCMHCGALERHRLTWLYFQRRTDLFDGTPKTVLHVAPEPVFEKQLRVALGERYITADLFQPSAMVRMDVSDIQYPDGSFDVVYCSHVLEHVPDDRKAMREFYRTLRIGGWAVLLVPITAPVTIEDPAETSPRERLRRFGQEDHVRRYGPDYPDRLRAAGFDVRVTRPADFLTPDEITTFGITPAAGEIYHCTKLVAS